MTLLFLQYLVFIGRKIERLRKSDIEANMLPSELADVKMKDEIAP